MLVPAKAKRSVKRFIPLYLMALPATLYLFINNYIPMGGLIVAFKNYSARKGILGSKWAGFKNFIYLFRTSDALIITRNTILYNLSFIILDTVLAVAIAILLSKIISERGRKFYQSVILLPHLISMVIVSYLVFGFLSAENGFINDSVLRLLGREGVSWYNEPKYWPAILIMVHIWSQVGYTCIVYYATVIGIDSAYYEAANLEGAGNFQQIRFITLPLLKPVIITMVMLSVGRIFFSDFSLFYQVPMDSGALYPTTQVIDTYVYRSLLQQGNIAMSAAAGFYQSVVGFVVVLFANFLLKRIDHENALF